VEKTTRLICAFIIVTLAALLVFAACRVSVSAAEASELNDAQMVQMKLAEHGFYKGAIDGTVGPATKAAVKEYQKSVGLVADGIVGVSTAYMLKVRPLHIGSEVYLLAKCIYAEARGEPYLGQVAVGAVVMNRLNSKLFPSTVAAVIYEPWAFTAVNDGQINLEPNQTAIRAALDAISGQDPTGGCLFYYNPTTATCKWIRTREIHLEIGNHVFCH
jgi:N-acetylmuramoyl-L-alanine amidase